MTNNTPAGFWKRLLAYTLNLLILFLPQMLLLLQTAQEKTLAGVVYWLFVMILFSLSGYAIFYTIFFTYYFSGDLGKLITGLRVRALDGSKLSFKRILFRQTIGYMFSTLIFNLGYVSIAKDPQKQAWHDKTIGSNVYEVQKLWPLSLVTLIGMISLYGYLFQTAWQKASMGPLRFEVTDLLITLTEEAQKAGKKDNKMYYPDNYISAEFAEQLRKLNTTIENENFTAAITQGKILYQDAKTNNEKAVASKKLAEVSYQLQQNTAALEYANEAIERYPNYALAYSQRALIHDDMGKQSEALQDARKAVEFVPEDAHAHYVLGVVLFNMRNYEESIKALKVALRLDPQNSSYKTTLESIQQRIEKSLTPTPSQKKTL